MLMADRFLMRAASIKGLSSEIAKCTLGSSCEAKTRGGC